MSAEYTRLFSQNTCRRVVVHKVTLGDLERLPAIHFGIAERLLG